MKKAGLTLRLLAAADFHGSVEAAKNLHSVIKEAKPDLVLGCGDISDFGDARDVQVVLEAFLNADAHGCYVTGNCDPPELLEKGAPGFEEQNLHGRTRLYGETMLLGIGGSTPTPFPTPGQLREEEILALLEKLERDSETQPYETLVFLLHNPPFNTKTDFSSSGTHAGSRVIRDYVERLKPQVIFHGHIHEARGVDKIQESYVVNPGPAFQGYYAMADLEDGRVAVKLLRV